MNQVYYLAVLDLTARTIFHNKAVNKPSVKPNKVNKLTAAATDNSTRAIK